MTQRVYSALDPSPGDFVATLSDSTERVAGLEGRGLHSERRCRSHLMSSVAYSASMNA